MISIARGLLLLSTAGAVSLPLVVPTRQAPERRTPGEAAVQYSKSQVEYYLTQEEMSYARPGLEVEIVAADIPADGHAVVEVTFVDDMGQPLDRAGVMTPGDISMSWVIAWYDGDLRQYTAYTTRDQTSPITGVTENQASSDSGGTWEDLGIGRARYTFGTQLPGDFDDSKTHTVYVYATRNTADILGKDYYSDPTYDFRPDGGEVEEQWGSLATEQCNTCHDPIAMHGGRRRAVNGCVMCHNPQSVDPDTGNTVDMKVMIHKIHFGANLPSVQAGIPYQIIGFRQSVHDYSEVVLPQDVRNCWSCHPEDAPQGHVWYSEPARASCGSCHDDIDWETGEGHNNVAQETDNQCSLCHIPQGEFEFDASVIGAHTIPTKSTQLAGLNMEILEVTDTGPGSNPTVIFQVTNDDGSVVNITGLDRMRLRWGGPTTDYTADFEEDAFDAVVSGDMYMKTLSEPIPVDATGTWAFSADVYRFVMIDDGSNEGLEVREAAYNPIWYAPVTDAEAEPRREVVDLDKCNVCHDVLALHGGQRFAIEECLICHRPDMTDEDDRPEEEAPPESVHFKYMIHKIHTGHELVLDYTVYGFRGSENNYNHVGYPGDRRNCEGCHLPGTYSVPVTDDALETPTERDWYSPMLPAAAACLPCHGTVDAAAHAYVNTAPFGESCASCHGDDREFSVEKVHAR
jgi:OmcA/MtrC family decaheme c-type cytochrome